MMLVPDHPAIRRAERYGMEEAERIGYCENCGTSIYAGYEHGIYQNTTLFCSAECFHEWIDFEVVDTI